jgi:diguanylate cyclase (GGDEF)-like protein/PAS domain S-box-containing protein
MKTSLRGVVTGIGATVAIVTAVSLPAAYFAAGYANLSHRLGFEAELNASYLAKYISGHTALWQFQNVRIAELLSQIDAADSNFNKRVVDSSNRTVLDEGEPAAAPTLARRHSVVVAGTTVAYVEIEASLQPLLKQSALAALFGGLLGLGIFFALRIFPLRVLDRTLGELKRSSGALEQTNERFKAALTHMSHGLSMFDGEGRLVVNNDRFTEMYGISPETVKAGSTFLDFLEHRALLGGVQGEALTHGEELQEHLRLGEPEAEVFAASSGRSIAVISNPLPTGGWVSTHEDITEKLAAQAKISHMALHDALTNLPNRVFLRQQMEIHLSQLGRDQKFAVLCLDLDRFKVVNDSLGHPVGDKLLREVAVRARKCLREGDTLARIGGDEFVILQAQVNNAEDASALAARLIEEIGCPFDLDGHQVSIGISVGIALAPGDADGSDELLRNADMALYRAKAEGRGTYRFFEAEMDRLMQARRILELDLRKAIVNNEFVVFYQPLIKLQTEEICGFEALVRWNHPLRGLVPPLDFIPLAEETGLIVQIGEWVLRNACAEAAKWPKDIRVAVNLSPSQFKVGNISQMVVSALAHSGLEAARLELEITESVLLFDNAATLETLHQLKNLGVRISMDDFGTGYSSLSYLRSFPFDKIKIDRSFVHELERKEDSKAIIRAVTGLGASLGMSTTGEGVESQAEVDYLRGEGCTEAQGYFFSKPKPASEVFKMLAERNTALSAVA